MTPARIHEATIRGYRALRLENGLIGITVLVDKGADIYEFTHIPSGMDVLWKTPWGLKLMTAHSDSSGVAWRDRYEGGWQLLLPSAGAACVHRGVEIPHHGEACVSSWEVVRAEGGASAELELRLSLSRLPLVIERRMALKDGQASLEITERVTNEGPDVVEYMWAHHPAIGAPFLGPGSILQTGAQTFVADDAFASEWSPVEPGSRHPWPNAVDHARGTEFDLSKMPAAGERRALLGYLTDFDAGWWSVTSPAHALGLRLEWTETLMPYAYLWQEFHASAAYPWWGRGYVLAVEPATSIPARGLAQAVASGTHRSLEPSQSDELTLIASLASTE